MAKFRNRTLIFVCLRTKIPPAVLAVMCGVSLEYFGDCHVTGTWLVLLRQSTVRCLSVDSVHIQCGGDVSTSLSAYSAWELIK